LADGTGLLAAVVAVAVTEECELSFASWLLLSVLTALLKQFNGNGGYWWILQVMLMLMELLVTVQFQSEPLHLYHQIDGYFAWTKLAIQRSKEEWQQK
jgi:hypothetical protein